MKNFLNQLKKLLKQLRSTPKYMINRQVLFPNSMLLVKIIQLTACYMNGLFLFVKQKHDVFVS